MRRTAPKWHTRQARAQVFHVDDRVTDARPGSDFSGTVVATGLGSRPGQDRFLQVRWDSTGTVSMAAPEDLRPTREETQ